MMRVRAAIIKYAGVVLAKALLIGTRYAVCRRQFSTIEGSSQERQLLDYQTHMVKFGPLLAQSYAMIFAGKFVD